MLGQDLLIIGQQVHTASGNRLDLLGIDADGDLHIIELKRDRTPRDVVAQVLDYASWVRDLSYEDVTDIFDDFDDSREFEQAFGERFSSARLDGTSGVRRTSTRLTASRLSLQNLTQQPSGLWNTLLRNTTCQSMRSDSITTRTMTANTSAALGSLTRKRRPNRRANVSRGMGETTTSHSEIANTDHGPTLVNMDS